MTKFEIKKIELNGFIHNFSIGYDFIDVKDILHVMNILHIMNI